MISSLWIAKTGLDAQQTNMDVIANNLEVIFPGMVIESCELFRVTRNAITEKLPDQAVDLLSMIESALRDRKFAEIVCM